MDGDEEIGMHGVGALSTFEKSSPRRSAGDEQHGLIEPGVGERLFDVPGELKIERIFGHAARAGRAGHVEGMADVDDDAKFGALATLRLCRDRRGLLAARRLAVAGKKHDRDDGADREPGVPQTDHDAPLSSAVIALCEIAVKPRELQIHRAFAQPCACARRAPGVPNVAGVGRLGSVLNGQIRR